LVIIDEPRGEDYYGAKVAAPAFARITSETLRYLGVPPSEPTEPVAAQAEEAASADENTPGSAAETPGAQALSTVMTSNPDEANAVLVPDFGGMGIARALELAREHGLVLEIEGTGRVVSQVPPPGLASAPRSCKLVFAQELPSYDSPSRAQIGE
jgi:cell division protein FtsI (penicillin-binding protein 3)